MGKDILNNWEQKSKNHRKNYQQLLKRADKNKMLKQLPSLSTAAYARVDCLECARCCKNYSPRFKTTDIRRIARFLNMKESVFIDRYLRVDEDGDFVVKSSPCPFLNGDNSCSIYEQRPSDCARFPYTDEDVLIKRTAITLKNSEFCPITFYVLEQLLEQAGLTR
ncbi:YkgJ family cysteine cluster protein [Niabella terrae]